MLIKEQELRHWIDNFYGYGSWQATFWFIDHEEGGGELPEEVAEKLSYFSKYHASNAEATLCDMRDMYRHIAFRAEGPKAGTHETRYDYRFGNNAALNGIWKNLIAFMHGHKGQELPDLLSYQKASFLSPSKNHEVLIRLFPLPSPHNHAWYYSWLEMPNVPFIKTRMLYQDHLYERRINEILRKIQVHKPRLVLMYGMTNINVLKNSIQKTLPGAKFRMNKAIKLQIPQHHRADFDGTTILITTQIPALRHNRIETGFDWYRFGQRVRTEA